MSLGTSAALSKPLWALSEPLFGVCAACSCSGGVLGAQAGAAGEGRRKSSASSCPCKELVRRLLFFQATSEWGKVLSQGVEELISERAQARGVCRSSLTQIYLSQGWRSTCSRAGGPQAQTDPTGLCRDRSGLESTAGRAGHSRTRSCQGILRQQCQGHAADCSEGLHGGELAFPSSLTPHVTRLRTEHA